MTKRKGSDAEAAGESAVPAAVEAAASEAVPYSKEQLLQSSQYAQLDKDVLTALLEDEGLYTKEEAQAVIDQFMKRAVL
ncbi:hypothetical protein WMW72_31745 [Paenibacillus filicis]|uniref:YqzN/YkzM domain-containing protein n=1 Tax=Paenibacillus filicis TaxID=669464 RepID=A0ABU9DUV4_9BACL